MTQDQEERLVLAFERVATGLRDIHDELRRAGYRYWPEQRAQREAVVTKVETDEERERKNQGARKRNIADVTNPDIDEEDEDEYIGERTRQFLRDHPEVRKKKEPNASAETAPGREPDGAGAQAAPGNG